MHPFGAKSHPRTCLVPKLAERRLFQEKILNNMPAHATCIYNFKCKHIHTYLHTLLSISIYCHVLVHIYYRLYSYSCGVTKKITRHFICTTHAVVGILFVLVKYIDDSFIYYS